MQRSQSELKVYSKTSAINKLPCELDAVLNALIKDYTNKKGNTYASLAHEMKLFVETQYRDAYALIEEGSIDEDQLEKHIEMHCPRRSYLHQYANGRPICFRYTNTIANFFDVEYTIRSFSPADDLVRQILLKRD